jgi:hypothetical protein
MIHRPIAPLFSSPLAACMLDNKLTTSYWKKYFFCKVIFNLFIGNIKFSKKFILIL